MWCIIWQYKCWEKYCYFHVIVLTLNLESKISSGHFTCNMDASFVTNAITMRIALVWKIYGETFFLAYCLFVCFTQCKTSEHVTSQSTQHSYLLAETHESLEENKHNEQLRAPDPCEYDEELSNAAATSSLNSQFNDGECYKVDDLIFSTKSMCSRWFSK